MSVIAVLAHQGGWDEILLVVAPMLVVGGLLWIAKRRVDRAAKDRGTQPAPASERPAAAFVTGDRNERSEPLDPGADSR